MRRDLARHALDTGTDLMVVRLSGRQRFDTTSRYTRPIEGDSEKAAKRLETV